MYRRLLIPLDGSRLAEVVLPMVERLSAACGASIVLLHIIERRAPTSIHGDRHLSSPDEATLYLQGVAASLRDIGRQVDLHTHDAPEGDVARSIVDHANEVGSDLIVMCAHGHGGVRELVSGNIAQQVLRHGSLPVMLVRPSAQGTVPPFQPQMILVPLDGSAGAEVALEPALQLARVLHAGLHLLMVVPTQSTIVGERTATTTLLPIASQAALDLESDEARLYLAKLVERLSAEDTQITTEVGRGDVPAVLVATAAEQEVGLVVLASHGRSGVQTIWSRSVTAGLLARPGIPLLLLRRD